MSLGAGLFLYGIAPGFLSDCIFPVSLRIDRVFAFALLIGFPVVTGSLVDLNYVSIHRYYRDRLMGTFMPDIAHALNNETGAALGADGANLQEVCDPSSPRSPYHILNTNVVLVNSDNQTYKSRGGDNFILSPLYCGSGATGWSPTTAFMGGKMTLATAVAVSGAAVNPNTGVGGAGLTRNPVLSLVMSLLNLRLGYWAWHPDPGKRPFNAPNHFRPGAYAFWSALGFRGLGFDECRPVPPGEERTGLHSRSTAVPRSVRKSLRSQVAPWNRAETSRQKGT